jgi:surface polysaccharide O-acyltransferase-like enzyme
MKPVSALKRFAYLDALKVIAIYFVVVIHVIGFKVASFDNGVGWFIAHFFSMASRFAVPVFVMCSGAVLLARTVETSEDVIQFYKRYLVSYTGYLFLGLFVAKILSLYLGHDEFTLRGLVYDFYVGFGAGMWFFFMLIGLVLVTPLLQSFVRNRILTKLFLILWIFFCIANPMLSNTLGFYRTYVDNMLFGLYFVGYFVLGYFLASTGRRFRTKALVISAISGLVLAAVAGYALSLQQSTLHEYFYYSNNPFIFIYTISIFLIGRNIYAEKNSGIVLRTLSSVTGYVYIFHTAVMSFIPIGYSQNIFVLFFIRVPVVVFVTMALSFGYKWIQPLLQRVVFLPVHHVVKFEIGRIYAKLYRGVQPHWIEFKAWVFY